MITAMISRLMILAFGTLYPAYASYKAVRTKDVKEYVKWMMYWIVFALFTCAETFTDVFFSFWFPFYYEIKVALVFWLLSPATKGSSFLYRNFVHPALQRRESEIDEMLSHAKEKGYNTVLSIGTKGVSYATNVLLQTAMRTVNQQQLTTSTASSITGGSVSSGGGIGIGGSDCNDYGGTATTLSTNVQEVVIRTSGTPNSPQSTGDDDDDDPADEDFIPQPTIRRSRRKTRRIE